MSKHAYIYLGIFLWITTLIFVAAPIWPFVFYRLSPGTSEVLASTIGNTTSVLPSPTPTPESTPNHPVPTPTPTPEPPIFDPSLPEENGLIIEEIGVRGQINEGDDWSEILKKGIWRVPNFGTPEENELPVILAAHRWGYVTWTNSFRTLNSFYNLPKLEDGNLVEIVWNQRKYVYQIYDSQTGTGITDYDADLILYTCELWNSPTRIFKYARRVI